MAIPVDEIQSKNTIKNKVNNVATFLTWCDESLFIDANMVEFKKVFNSITTVRKNKSKRVGYSPDELERLFNSKPYLNGTHKSPAHHWIPLIALFTGARLNEICQLYKNNIVKDSLSGIIYFDFNDYSDDQGKKTDAGLRFVPICNTLKKIGFLKYIASIDDGCRLFPMLNKRDNGYTAQMSKWFNTTYKNANNCNIIIPKGIKKDFHSFRNTLINTIKQAGFPVASAREIAGHEDGSLTFGGYADPLDLPNRKKIIDKIEYPSVDWHLLKEREWR